jgi:hypothetical protein
LEEGDGIRNRSEIDGGADGKPPENVGSGTLTRATRGEKGGTSQFGGIIAGGGRGGANHRNSLYNTGN